MMVQSRQEVIEEFLKCCKTIQKYSEYILIEISYSSELTHNFQCREIEEVEKLIQDSHKLV